MSRKQNYVATSFEKSQLEQVNTKNKFLEKKKTCEMLFSQNVSFGC